LSRRTTNEGVNQAIEDLANGNRPLTSKATLQCRLSEVWSKRHAENEEFKKWKLQMLRVKE
jgi:hypothetical protein